MRLIFFRIAVVLIFSTSLVQAQVPLASFIPSSTTGCPPLLIQFQNTSSGSTAYSWDFGNGNTSSQVQPSNVFSIPGTYTVTLTASNGANQSTYSQQITVLPAPQSAFSAQTLSDCQSGSGIQFINSSLNFDSCLWDFGDGTTSSSVNPLHVYHASGQFTVTLVCYNSQYGCSDIETRVSYITIHPKPSVTLLVDTSVTCDLNHAFQFTATAQSPVSNWSWSFGDGAGSSLSSPQHTYAAPGSYSVSVVTQNSFGCTAQSILADSIEVLPNPVPLISLSNDSGCTPFNVSFNSNVSSYSSVFWDFGNGLSASTKGTYTTYDSAGIFTPTLYVLYQNGCSRVVATGPIWVESSPSPSFVMQNYSGCAPLTVQFINSTPPGNYSWYWDFGDGDTASSNNPIHTYDSVGYFIPSLVATSPNGCTNIIKNNWYFVSSNGPLADFTSDVQSGCFPLSVNFSDNSTNAVSWNWDFGDGSSSTQQFPSHTYMSPGNYTVRLIVNSSGGCTDTLIQNNAILVSSAQVNFVPPSPITACAPHTVLFSDATGAVAWQWDFGDGTLSTDSSPMHTYTQAGVYTVSLTTWAAPGGCGQIINDFQTFIIDGSEGGFTYTVTSCPPYEVQFTDTSSNAVAWSWNFGDGGTAASQHPAHIYPNPGNYDISVQMTSAFGCKTNYVVDDGVQISGLGANANASTNDTIPPFTVNFYANSTEATWWLWSFGDGDSSSLENPVHVYTTAGPFTISLTIGNDSCQFTYDYPPMTFGGLPNGGTSLGGTSSPDTSIEYHCAPFTVNFLNPDQAAVAWNWDFGDGQFSNDPNPIHTYSDSGAFSISVQVTDTAGNTYTIVQPQIYHVVKPINDFSMTTINTCQGVQVSLQASGNQGTFQWNLGNGQTSTQAQPVFTLPNLSSSYIFSLSVTDTNLCSAFIAKSFFVNSQSPLTASRRRVCAGDSIRFACGNMNFSTYSWSFGDGSLSTQREPVYSYSDSGLFSVSMTATDFTGCTQTFWLSFQVEVFDPQAAFTYVTSSNCTTVTLNLQNQSINSDRWTWSFGDGTGSSLFKPVHYYTQPGLYDLTLTAYKNVCSHTVQVPAAVYYAQLNPDFQFSQDSLCLPRSIPFTDLSTDAVSWFWDFGDGDTSSVQSPLHFYTSEPVGPVSLRVKDVNGCTKTISKTAPSFSFPSFSLSSSGSCNPVTVSFSDSSSGATAWLWDFGDGSVSTQSNPTHQYSVNGNYTVQLTIQSTDGCSSTLKMDSVVQVSNTEANFSADTLEGCVPLLVNFNDSSTNAVSWSWDFGDGGNSGLKNPDHLYTQPGQYTVRLVVSNSNGCIDSLTYTTYVLVNGSEPGFQRVVSDHCSPVQVQFSDLSTGAVSRIWYFGDGLTDTSANPVHQYQQAGLYTATLYTTDSTGCVNSYSDPLPIEVHSSPSAYFTISDSLGCGSLTVHFQEVQVGQDSLVWDFGDGNTYNGSSPSYTYSNPGIYYASLSVYTNEGCAESWVYPVPIQINMQPQAFFTVSQLAGCAPVTVHFDPQCLQLDSAQFNWQIGSITSHSDSAFDFVFSDPGFYSVSLQVVNSGGCQSNYTLPQPISVFDTLIPEAVYLYRVSVNDLNHVEVQWPTSTELEADHYLVLRSTPGRSVWDTVAVLPHDPATLVNTYSDLVSTTTDSIYRYKVVPVDVCGLHFPADQAAEQGTINISALAGKMKAQLNWTPYGGCPVARYEVYRLSDSLTGYQLIADLPSYQLEYTDTSAICAIPYSYKIRARDICLDQSFDSWSDSVTVIPVSKLHEQEATVVRSTVVDDRSVLTEWHGPVLLPEYITSYSIYRSVDSSAYRFINAVPAGQHYYSDYDVNVDHSSYRYKIEVINVCSQARLSSPGTSILLRSEVMEGLPVKFHWSPYTEWEQGVSKYRIEEQNADGSWKLMREVPGNTTSAEEE